MKKYNNVTVSLSERSYDIAIMPGILNSDCKVFSQFVQNKKCFVISDSNVFPLYGNATIAKLSAEGGRVVGQFVFSAGEQSKILSTVEEIYHEILKCGLDRSSVIIALGGGVVGDMAGFVAATYMRGIDFIQIPTSLLAMVDSSVGGKTGVDMSEGKNLIGVFWQPKFVLIDPSTLTTLPEREVKGGLAEVIKYSIILERDFFDNLLGNVEKILNLDLDYYSTIITKCCKLKAEIVRQDEKETGMRGLLNYGHTFGHAIENIAGYGRYIHGEAVGIGMLMAAEMAFAKGIFDHAELEEIVSLFKKLNLYTKADNIDSDAMFVAMAKDKKTKDGTLCFVLPEKIGKANFRYETDKDSVIDIIKKYT